MPMPIPETTRLKLRLSVLKTNMVNEERSMLTNEINR